jgi:Holliday junction resolvase RusA-like endonuclease
MPAAYGKWVREALPHVPALFPAFNGTVGIVIESVLPHFKTVVRDAPKGDVDNYAKSVMDLLTKAVDFWGDDAQVLVLHTHKRFVKDGERPFTYVYVKEVNPL